MTSIRHAQQVAGGYLVDVEVPNAYTDGTSRIDRVFVRREEVEGKTVEQRLRALKSAIAAAPFGELASIDLAAPVTRTKAVIEGDLADNLQDWRDWQWRLDRIADYGLAGAPLTAVTTAITNRRDAAAQRDLALLQEWRTAP